jgi:hypothetical protein
MMTTKKKSLRRPANLMVMLPSMATLFFSVQPVHAGIQNMTPSFSKGQLTGFEGYYQLDKDKNQYLQIKIKDENLVLKQLWDQREITQVLAFERDTWVKVKNYKPVEKKEISLSAKKMQAYEGKFKITDDGHEAFLQFTVAGNALVVKELWSEKTYTIIPESEFVFFAKDGYYPVQFSKDKDGNVTPALIFNKDVWLKVKGQE